MKDETPANEPLHYQNGQSDAEKLMRRHLQNPDDVITDEELKNLKIAGTPETLTPDDLAAEARAEEEAIKQKESGHSTPWDVVDP